LSDALRTALMQALGPQRQPKRNHLTRITGRLLDGSKRQIVVDRSKYPPEKLRELRKEGKHR
jgi:hypothetical protein